MFCVTEQGIRQQAEMAAKAAKSKHPERADEPPLHTAARAAQEAQREDAGRDDDSAEEVAEADETKGYRPYLAEGHAADSPQNGQRAGGAGRHPGSGQYRGEVAAGHGIDGSGRMGYQPGLEPLPLAGLATMTGSQGALASALAEHQGAAMVAQIAASQAASPGLAGQLGRNAPSGIPGQPPVHVAPTGVGARFRVSPPRANAGGMASLPAPGGA